VTYGAIWLTVEMVIDFQCPIGARKIMPKKPSLEIKQDPSRKRPFYFSIPASCSSSGIRERRYFETKGEAKTGRELELTRINNFGTSQATLPSEVRRDAVRAEKLLEPHGLTVFEAVRQFIDAKETLDQIDCSVPDAAKAHLQSELDRAKSSTLTALFSEFLLSKEQEKLSDAYLTQIERCKDAFDDDLGQIRCCDLTTKLIRQSLSRFEDRSATYSAHLRILKAVLNFGIEHDYLVNNPAQKVKPPKQAPREVGILTNAQVKALLLAASNEDKELLPFFAISIFAGLRPTEVSRLDWADINLAKKEIFVRTKGASSKERVGRSVPITKNLGLWLKQAMQDGGKLTPKSNFRKRFEAVRDNADETLLKVKMKKHATLSKEWDADCMRHTAASNWDALTGNMARTALWLGHTEQVHRRHYYHPVNEAEAKEFWKITPNSRIA